MKKPPTHEQALEWARTRARLVMTGVGTPTDEMILVLLHYIRRLEKTAKPEDVIQWD